MNKILSNLIRSFFINRSAHTLVIVDNNPVTVSSFSQLRNPFSSTLTSSQLQSSIYLPSSPATCFLAFPKIIKYGHPYLFCEFPPRFFVFSEQRTTIFRHTTSPESTFLMTSHSSSSSSSDRTAETFGTPVLQNYFERVWASQCFLLQKHSQQLALLSLKKTTLDYYPVLYIEIFIIL